jgi:sulfatase maturation enzyme AslB (radical SAM superfamily)
MIEISTLELSLVSFCEHVCKYCPQKDLHQAYKNLNTESSTNNQNYMPFDKFQLVLSKVPNHTWIDYSGTAEPTLHPKFVDFVNHTYKTHKTIRLYSTLAGLKAEEIDNIDSAFQVVVLHLPDSQNIMRLDLNEEYLDVIDKFTNKFKVIAEVYGDLRPELERFRRKFLITNRQLNSKDLISRGSLVSNFKLVKLNPVKIRQGKVRCKAVIDKQDQSLKHNVLAFDGSVYICCCSAFNLSHKIGNLFTDSYEDLFKSEEYLKMMRAQDDPEFRLANDIMCSKCELSIEV